MAEPRVRNAACQCGAFSAVATGAPAHVAQCHCEDCKKRTGSPYGLGFYFAEDQVALRGDRRTYARPTLRGNTLVNEFCPVCGTTLAWRAATMPGMIGLAAGCFSNADALAPTFSVFDDDRQAWVERLDTPTYRKGSNSPLVERAGE